MLSTLREVIRAQIPCAQLVQILRPQPRKFVEQLGHRLALRLPDVSAAIEGGERLAFAELEYDLRPQDPVCPLAVNQVPDDLEHSPGIFAFILVRPRFRQFAQKRIEGTGCAGEKRYSLLQVMFHRTPEFTYPLLMRKPRSQTLFVSAPRGLIRQPWGACTL